MLISNEIEVKWWVNTRNHYENLGYKFTKYRDVFKVKIEDVFKYSSYKVKVKCDYCGKIIHIPYSKHTINKTDITKKDCCKKCSELKKREIADFLYKEKITKRNRELKNIEEIKIDKNIKESDLEKYLIVNINKIEKGMIFLDNQVIIDSGRIDILARDKNNILCIIELKIEENCKDLIWQCVYYPTQFEEKVRMITICPDYSMRIHKALKSLNYVEIKKYEIDNGKLNVKNYKAA